MRTKNFDSQLNIRILKEDRETLHKFAASLGFGMDEWARLVLFRAANIPAYRVNGIRGIKQEEMK